MKKIALVLAVLLCALPMMAFAEVAATGSVSFSIGNTDETDPTLPAFTGAKSATATIAVSSMDEKVVASVGIDLLPAVTSTYTSGATNAYDAQYAAGYADANINGYADYLELVAIKDFWLDKDSAETPIAEATIWTSTTIQADLVTAINAATTDDVAYIDGAGYLEIKSAKAIGTDISGATATKFIFDDAAAGEMAAAVTAAYGVLDPAVAAAINKILDEATAATELDDITETVALNEVQAYVNGTLDYAEYATWIADDKDVLEAAIELEKDYYLVANPAADDPTVDSVINYITSASLSFKGVADVLDITFNLAGTHVAAGAISVDAAGHTDTAVSGYPSLGLALSSGVVEGLSAGVTLYIDDNDAGDAVADDFYTWLDETDDSVEPVYGLGVMAGYMMAMDDMSFGADVTLGLYDLLGGAADYAFSIAPSFSGFGANVDLQFDMGLGMTYFMAAVDYTVMGFTPNVAFYYAAATGDNVLAYSSSPASVMATFKDGTDGMLIAGGLSADLSELIGMGVSLSGGVEYGLSGAAASEMAWNAGLSVAGLVDGLTVGFDCSSDSVDRTMYDGTVDTGIDYAVSASYVYGIATLSASLGYDYNTDDEASYTSWSVGTTVSF